MSRSDIAEKYYDLINTFCDYIKTGEKTEYLKPDFSNLNMIDMQDKTSDINDNRENIIIQDNATKDLSQSKRNMIDLAEKISLCKNCPIHKNCQRKVVGRGTVPSKIFIVSFHTTDEEEREFRPLTGNILEQLNKWLKAININIEDVFISNLLKCNPKNDTIKKEYIENCLQYLNNEIEIVNPSILITLGDTVLSSLKKKFVDLNKYHGQIFYYNDIPFIPTYHPEFVLQNPYLKKMVWSDLKRFEQFYKGMISCEKQS